MIEQFVQLPKAMKVLVASLSVVSLVAIAHAVDAWAALYVLLGLVFIALAVLAWFFTRKLRLAKRRQQLDKQLAVNSSASPQSIADPSKRARLDDLRRNFSKGLE